MTTDEGLAIYSKLLTRTREIELERLKRENAALRALIQMHKARKLQSILASRFRGRLTNSYLKGKL